MASLAWQLKWDLLQSWQFPLETEHKVFLNHDYPCLLRLTKLYVQEVLKCCIHIQFHLKENTIKELSYFPNFSLSTRESHRLTENALSIWSEFLTTSGHRQMECEPVYHESYALGWVGERVRYRVAWFLGQEALSNKIATAAPAVLQWPDTSGLIHATQESPRHRVVGEREKCFT